MVYPVKFSLTYSYTGFQQGQGENDFPGTALDNDLANVKTTVDSLVDFMTVTLGADGRLLPQSVGTNALAFEIRDALSAEALALVDAIAANIALTSVPGMAATHVQNAIAELMAGKAAADHNHSASAIPVSAISGLAGATVQAALAELRSYAPSTGDAMLTLATVAPAGWVMMNDGTIGSATSGASTRAHADCELLYKLIYANVTDTYAPVTGGRGVSAAADWAANKPIALTKQLGRALAVSGAGSGLTSRALGQTVGTETHALTLEQLPDALLTTQTAGAHKHYLVNSDNVAIVQGVSGAVPVHSSYLITADDKIESTEAGGHVHEVQLGSGDVHPNMQPTAFWNIRIKL